MSPWGAIPPSVENHWFTVIFNREYSDSFSTKGQMEGRPKFQKLSISGLQRASDIDYSETPVIPKKEPIWGFCLTTFEAQGKEFKEREKERKIILFLGFLLFSFVLLSSHSERFYPLTVYKNVLNTEQFRAAFILLGRKEN